MADACIFCRIAAGEVPSQFVFQDDEIIVFRDIAPKAPVHLLVLPRAHIVSLAHTTPEQAPLLGRCLVVAAQVARQEGVAESGYRLIANSGPDSGMAEPHLTF